MKRLITPILLLCALGLFAQPTVKTDWLPSIGDELSTTVIPLEAAIDPGPAGASVVYDFSNVELPDTIETAVFQVLDAKETPFSDLFEDAELAFAVPTFGIYNYVRITDNCIEDIGGTFGGLSVEKYTDGKISGCTPLNYQDEFTDTFAGTSEFMGFVTFNSGSSQFLVDGWGTILMPGSGTEIGNVLRLKQTEISADSTELGNGIREKYISESTNYFYLSADYKNILVSYNVTNEMQIGMADGIPNDTLEFGPFFDLGFDPEPVELGTARTTVIPPARIGMNVFPNPAGERLNLQFEGEVRETVNISITDLTGRQVSLIREIVLPGQNTIPVDIDQLESGMYILTLQGASFTSSIKFTRR